MTTAAALITTAHSLIGAASSAAPIAAAALSRKKLTAGQVADLFGVRVETVRRWADAGRLPCTRTLGGDRRFDPVVVHQLLDAA